MENAIYFKKLIEEVQKKKLSFYKKQLTHNGSNNYANKRQLGKVKGVSLNFVVTRGGKGTNYGSEAGLVVALLLEGEDAESYFKQLECHKQDIEETGFISDYNFFSIFEDSNYNLWSGSSRTHSRTLPAADGHRAALPVLDAVCSAANHRVTVVDEVRRPQATCDPRGCLPERLRQRAAFAVRPIADTPLVMVFAERESRGFHLILVLTPGPPELLSRRRLAHIRRSSARLYPLGFSKVQSVHVLYPTSASPVTKVRFSSGYSEGLQQLIHLLQRNEATDIQNDNFAL